MVIFLVADIGRNDIEVALADRECTVPALPTKEFPRAKFVGDEVG
jgi:hypothetical protein